MNLMIKIVLYSIVLIVTLITKQVSCQTLDSIILKATYNFSFRPDSTNITYIRNDVMILEIGKKFSKFHSYYRYLRDSTIKAQLEYQRQNAQSGISVDMRGVTNNGSSRVVFRNNKSSSYIVTSNLGLSNYMYVDSVVDMKWRISQDTATINGYLCMKAETRFRGRNYIAWFTNQIPVSCGPYKFGGLPGLIINVKEINGNFEYKLLTLETVNPKTQIDFEKGKFESVSRQEFQKLVLIMINDPEAFLSAQGMQIHTKSIDGNTNPILPKPPKSNYNPMELE